MLQLWLVALGGLLSIAGGVVTALLRERHVVKGEDRAQVRRVRRVIYALLCVRDEVRTLASSLDLLPILETDSPSHEEELRRDLMTHQEATVRGVLEQLEGLLPELSEVDPFAANLIKMNADILGKMIEQDYAPFADDPVSYPALRRNERERFDNLLTMIDQTFDHLAKEADLEPARIRRAVQAMETRITAVEERVGIKRV